MGQIDNEFEKGLVLSGGGMLGAAHLGVLKRLEEINWMPDIISGTSVGALIGSLVSAGNSYRDIRNFFLELAEIPKFRFGLSRKSLSDIRIIAPLLSKYLRVKYFEELVTPLIICTTNLNSGKPTYFNSGSLLEPILASCAVPFIFSPILINNENHSDGGITDNLPIESLRPICKTIIASNLRPIVQTPIPYSNLLQISQRVFNISVAYHASKYEKLADYAVNMEGIDKFSLYKFNQTDQLIDLGYDNAKKILN